MNTNKASIQIVLSYILGYLLMVSIFIVPIVLVYDYSMFTRAYYHYDELYGASLSKKFFNGLLAFSYPLFAAGGVIVIFVIVAGIITKKINSPKAYEIYKINMIVAMVLLSITLLIMFLAAGEIRDWGITLQAFKTTYFGVT